MQHLEIRGSLEREVLLQALHRPAYDGRSTPETAEVARRLLDRLEGPEDAPEEAEGPPKAQTAAERSAAMDAALEALRAQGRLDPSWHQI